MGTQFKTKPLVAKLLYQLTYDVTTILDRNGIVYWGIGGTLLGSVRNKGIIPGDDDVDIGVMRKDLPKIINLRQQLKKCGYSLSKRLWFGYKIFYTTRPNVQGESYSFPSMDIFPYIKGQTTKIIPAYKRARDTWPRDWFYAKTLDTLHNYKFGNFTVKGPKYPKKYLDRSYGKDWNSVTYRQYDHSKEEAVVTKKVKLRPSDRVPAGPTKVVDRECIPPGLVTGNVLHEKYTALERKIGLRQYKKSCFLDRKCKNNFDERMGVYVINCDVHTGRMKKFVRYARKATINVCREGCINGRKFTSSVVCKMVKQGIVSQNANMNAIEVAIFMSHYNIWMRIVQNCENYGIVFEDDVEVKSNIVTRINKIMKGLQRKDIDFSILWLWNGNWMETDTKRADVTTVDRLLIQRERLEYNAGAVAYIISESFARYLIKHTFPIKEPVDLYIGSKVKVGNHLTLKMRYRKRDECYISPLLNLVCKGEYGTGESTQDYSRKIIRKETKCKRDPKRF